MALCTGHRENHPTTDAWEHHRAVRALALHLWHPGNPTYAIDAPSIRYSPYSVGLALVARATGVDPWTVLSGAAVANTLLLLAGIALLLRRFQRSRWGPALLVVMVIGYGGVPGYAGSLALADLPWHQPNPSAFAFGLSLWILQAFEGFLRRPGWRRGWPLPIALAGVALSHGMTALVCGAGLLALVLARPRSQWRRGGLALLGLAALAVGLSALWPWYDFLAVAFGPADPVWFNRSILVRMLSRWVLPSLLGSLVALPLRRDPLVRVALIAGGLCYGAGLLALPLHSAALARLPLPGAFFFHLPIAAFVHRTGLLVLRSWPGRLHRLTGAPGEPAAAAALETLLAAVGVLLLLSQLGLALRAPYLARPWVAPLLGRAPKALHLRQRLAALLEPVKEGEVVLADPVSAWPVPSLGGRIVSALHPEYGVADEARRRADVEAFFSPDPTVDRRAILRRWQVRWILLCPANLPPAVLAALRDPAARVRETDAGFLLDAHRWHPPPPRGRLTPIRPRVTQEPLGRRSQVVRHGTANP